MTHYTTTACILLAAAAAAAALFIRRAAIHRRRSHRAGTAPQPQPRPDTAQDDGYRRRYVLNRRDGAFRSGKTVRIRPEHYERLRQITARSGAVSMIAYVDNVLHAHFEDYTESIDLLSKRFIVFEIDAIKDNKELFPIVTIVLMEVFINKMRRLKGIRKMLIIEEAWKALASNNMASYVQYLYKTVRKHFGEVVTVTQEVQDIISSPIVKEAIINNSDCKILLDQRKFMNRFDAIQTLLGLTDKEKAQILSINMSNHPGRKYKEVWIGLGGVQSAVYATEVSKQEYLAYTTEESEKIEVQRRAESLGGDIELAIKQLAEK